MKRIFDPKKQNQQKGSFGSQWNIQNRWGIFKEPTLNFQAAQKYVTISKGVTKFINDYSTQIQQTSQFESILKTKIQNGVESLDYYDLDEIADFIPFIFSSKFLFEPVRSLLFCEKAKIKPLNYESIFTFANDQTINQLAIKAIYQSIKYGYPYLEKVIYYFSNQKLGLIYKGTVAITQIIDQIWLYSKTKIKQAIGLLGKIKEKAVQSIKYVIQKLGSWLPSILNSDFSTEKIDQAVDSVTTQTVKKGILQTLNELFNSCKVCGQVIICLDYLKSVCQTKMINGKFFYYQPEFPNLLFGVNSADVKAYVNNGTAFQEIPEKQFTISFLRSLLKITSNQYAGKLISKFQNILNDDSKNRNKWNNFRKRYILNQGKQYIEQEIENQNVNQNVNIQGLGQRVNRQGQAQNQGVQLQPPQPNQGA